MTRILLINPNTLASMTDLVERNAMLCAAPGVELRMATGRFGARYVASRAAYAIAGHAALDAYAEHGAGCAAVLLACFGDPGLLALKELAEVPVVGMAEAACHAAALQGRRFGIVTGGERWGPMLTEFVASLGLADRLVGIGTVAPTGAEIAAEPDRALAALAAACRSLALDDGADVVILGGAGLAGLARRIRDQVPVPLLCSLEAGMQAVQSLAASAPRKARIGSFAPTPKVETVGLSPELGRLLQGE